MMSTYNAAQQNCVLEVVGLCVDIAGNRVLDDVSLAVERGHIVGVVGASGAGKSTILAAINGLLPASVQVVAGKVLFYGKGLDASEEQYAQIRGGQVATVFQNSGAFLDPTMRVGNQMVEVLRCHRHLSADEARKEALSLFTRLALPCPQALLRAYPFELSGGMQQRISVALAMAGSPKLLLADEPTSALDPTTQVAIANELRRLRDIQDVSILLVTHNIGLAYRLCDELYVMEGGHVIESGPAVSVVECPATATTKQLIDAVLCIE